MKRIGIDARFFGSIGKGLGRYTQKLIENLEKIDQENQYFVFLRKENFDEYQPGSANFKKIMADYKWYGFSEQIFYPILLLRHDLDLMHFPHFNVPILYWKKIVVTIHDLILIHFPTIKNTTLNPMFYWVKFFAYKLTIWLAIRRAKKIIAVSNFTKKDILSNYNVPESKIAVTYEACESFCYFRQGKVDEILQKYGIMKPYLLYVGNAYPHKNLEFLALAFSRLKTEFENLSLVLVGKEDYFYKRLEGFISNEKIRNIVLPGFVQDKDLDEIYRNSLAYAFPSLYEGFGLPPLEAMSKGIPVLSSNHECMREVLGGSAIFADAGNVEDFSLAMRRIISDTDLRWKLSESGYERAASFSWRKMAKETLAIYAGVK